MTWPVGAPDTSWTVADEQAALVRIAHLVAGGAERAELFAAVARETSALVGGLPATLVRTQGPDTSTVVATQPGSVPPDVRELVAEILRTGRHARIDGDDAGSAGAPVTIDGRTWGVLAVTCADRRVPVPVAERLGRFTGLVTTAVATAHARAVLQDVAAEQSALRRVAELAAGGADPSAVLAAVAVEASRLAYGHAVTISRFDGPDGVVVVACHNGDSPIGQRLPYAPDTAPALIRQGAAYVRIDDFRLRHDAGAAARSGPAAVVAVPITAAGELWGLVFATSGTGPLPPDIEDRLAPFAQIASVALGDSQARAELRATADEQAALREVAELAAREESAAAVLDAVTTRVRRLPGVDAALAMRFEPDGTEEIVSRENPSPGAKVGMRAPVPPGRGIGPESPRGTTRVDDLSTVSGEWARMAQEAGFVASVTVPIPVEGADWGALVAVGRRSPLPAGVEGQLAAFADVAGIAIAAERNRDRLRALADEQAALRRVAELVARGAPTDAVFAAVADEASALLGDIATALVLYEGDDAVFVATCRSPGGSGLRVNADTGTAIDLVRRGRPARTETYDGTPLESFARKWGGNTWGLAVPIIVEGRVRAALTCTSSGPPIAAGFEERLVHFADLAAMAIANTETRAQLVASRARLVASADEARHRLQRDVHDGAQQRLVHTIIALKFARSRAASGGSAGDLIGEALAHAERAAAELRDLVHGILPASLTRGGLAAGLESLAVDLPLPVEVDADVPRLPAATETTAYFVVAEALTNVVKHAGARRASVRIGLDRARLSIEVSDDGTGGADPARGTGLTGLLDRVDAAEGSLTITSPAGHGTVLRAVLPVPPGAGPPDPGRPAT